MTFVLRYKFHILIFLLGVFVLTKFFVDPDLGWNLVMGREFFRFGVVGGVDHFSWTMPGYFWPNTFLGHQIIFSYFFDKLGFFATAIFYGVVASVAILILVPKRIPGVALFVMPVTFGLAASILGLRPHNLDFLLFSIVVVMMLRKHFGYRFWPFWFLLFLFWGNTHAGFLAGFAIFATFLLLSVFEKSRKFKLESFFRPAGLIVLCFLATLITPFSFHSLGNLMTNYVGLEGFWYIAEYQPPILYMPQGIFFAVSGLFLVWALKKAKKDDWPLLLVSISVFMFAFVSALFLVYWAVLFTVLMFDVFKDNQLPKIISGAGKNFIVRFSIVIAVLAILLNFVANLITGYSLYSRLLLDRYPVNALSYMKSHGYVKNVFNRYDWGGFIIWQAPQMKVFIDGRMTGWQFPDGRGILGDYLKINKGDCEPLSKYDVRVVLLGSNDPSECFSGFKNVYGDETAKVLIRR